MGVYALIPIVFDILVLSMVNKSIDTYDINYKGQFRLNIILDLK